MVTLTSWSLSSRSIARKKGREVVHDELTLLTGGTETAWMIFAKPFAPDIQCVPSTGSVALKECWLIARFTKSTTVRAGGMNEASLCLIQKHRLSFRHEPPSAH
jgi:hypothetical protein